MANILHAVKSYARFFWRSTNEHGVHSPFVFSLVTKCFYDRKIYPEYELLRHYRKQLASNNETIRITDFGAGSTIFRSNKRVISDIAKHAGITPKRAELLFRTVQYFRPVNILELGTSLGLATSALALGNPNAATITLEGCPETAAVAEKSLAAAGLHNARIKTGEFSDSLSKLPYYGKPENIQASQFPTFIYFDGNHQKDATLDYFQKLLPVAANDSVWIFDDIHWSAGMEEAWEIIKQNPKVTVTIDTFQWGFVFFRKEQAKENFTIRI